MNKAGHRAKILKISGLRLKFLSAFTLAEILITLGIIGVVAAMTIPTLIGNINDIRFRSQFFKSYSLIQQTFKRMEADDVVLVPTGYDRTNNSLAQNIKKYMTNIVDCGDYANQKYGKGCFDHDHASYYAMNGISKLNSQWFDDGQFSMPDGTTIIIEQPLTGSQKTWIWLDVNGGTKLPNKLGYDLFCFQLTEEGLKPMGAEGTTYADNDNGIYCNKNGAGSFNGMSCANKLIQNPQDYYKWLRRKGD